MIKPLVLLFLSFAPCSFAEPQVQTLSGTVQGFESGSVSVFLGIPYAEPPVSDRRFRPPTAKAPWPGVKVTTRFAEKCVQLNQNPEGSEDCLYLNVWVPESNGESLPTMVFFHGGGLMIGGTSDAGSDGKDLARREKVIVVSIAYRLGALGYLAHPALTAETAYRGSGNYGLMDQILGYTWVTKNISRFGGDPKRLTIFGQSSGATSVCGLLTSPLSKNLVQAAIMQSQWCQSEPLADTEAKGLRLAALAGCSGTSAQAASCLRNAPAESFARIPMSMMLDPSAFIRTYFTLTVDNYSLVEEPMRSVASGRAADVPMIVGGTSLDGLGLAPLIISPRNVFDSMTPLFGWWNRAMILDRYSVKESELDSPVKASEVINDFIYYCQARRLARLRTFGYKSPTYVYVYGHVLTSKEFPVPPIHASELVMLFGKVTTPEDLRVQNELSGAWGEFARRRTPNRGASASDLWQPANLFKDYTMKFGAPSELVSDYRAERCNFVENILQSAPY